MQNLFIALITILLVVGCGSNTNSTHTQTVAMSVNIEQNSDEILLNYTIETNESIEMAVLKMLFRDSDGIIVKKDELYVTDFIDINSSWREIFSEPLYGFKSGSYSVTIDLCDGEGEILASDENNFTLERDIAGENVYLEEFLLQKIYKDHPTRLKVGRKASVKIKTNKSTRVIIYMLNSNEVVPLKEEWIDREAIIDFTIPESFADERVKIFVSFYPINSENLEDTIKNSRRNGVFLYIVP